MNFDSVCRNVEFVYCNFDYVCRNFDYVYCNFLTMSVATYTNLNVLKT